MNIPSTFIFGSTNKKQMPDKLLAVFLKNVFRFGRKGGRVVNGPIHLYLNYSPRNETVEAKVKQLLVRYMRVVADNEEELQLFLKGLQKFPNVNLYSSPLEVPLLLPIGEATTGSGSGERKKKRW
ncbi:uncharacterized protein LOC132695547 [Cylas formicarius]|uniref:uncharacterized protein LOC132695547 n=1 Tax=Cylas formicarius TaxID=197179 RepID=UPI002958ADFE|nr:uncharacterized protein LOC132695547 [Cylas formicarius]